ncbi:hypothetical protein [Aliikangiella coralliicola]|uniref:Uncharacterized protein n=1 Tax=Aliikangiella coralliicola TaxID=2592383 RepID=A0A545UH63_9GAMM|nr:hypothetical protein [Aliikangiella coralliicola]TQV88800.1 hypothetical protein FLL46_04510 [Aliikangiella coralliicola]
MSINSSDEKLSDIEGFDELENAYRKMSTEMPDLAIDKQIIAAAHRELSSPNPKKIPKVSWWKRLALPLYATATFAFTAIAAHWLWPAPVKMPPGTTPGPVTIDLVEPKTKAPKMPSRKQRKLPELDYSTMPEADKSQSQNTVEEPLSGLEETMNILPPKGESQQQDSVADSSANRSSLNEKESATKRSDGTTSVAKLSFPDKEEWAREIIELFKKGDFGAARTELVRFKKAYPDYPIDEQIEAFRR